MTSDDLDLRKGHLGLRTMLRYVTDPNHVDSSAAYAFIPGILPRKPLNGNVKHFVFDLTCDVTGDLEVKFLNFIWKISSRPFHCRLNFSPTSVGFRDRWGGADTAPQQRVGSGLGPAGRGLRGLQAPALSGVSRRFQDFSAEALRGNSFSILSLHRKQSYYKRSAKRGASSSVV